jgi:hypothetical protein
VFFIVYLCFTKSRDFPQPTFCLSFSVKLDSCYQFFTPVSDAPGGMDIRNHKGAASAPARMNKENG